MSINFSKYPSIGQFRNAVKAVERDSMYVFDTEKDDWVFDRTRQMPTLTFTGTVKLHGSNAGVYFTKKGGISGQSRTAGIDCGLNGFGEWLASDDVNCAFRGIRWELLDEYPILEGKDFVIYGEWCGGNIQKGVSINGLHKMFVIFGVKVIEGDEDEDNHWINTDKYEWLHSHPNNVYDIKDFGTFSVDIDFANPGLSSNIMAKITEQVEQECPVGKAFGRVLDDDNTTGEGVVWTHQKHDGTVYRFKVKGEKHSSSKVKTLAPVDIEKLTNISEFIDYAVTESRLHQAASEVLSVLDSDPTQYDFDRKKIGEVIKWVSRDVLKEEVDTLVENGLTMKDVGNAMSKACQKWFFNMEGDV